MQNYYWWRHNRRSFGRETERWASIRRFGVSSVTGFSWYLSKYQPLRLSGSAPLNGRSKTSGLTSSVRRHSKKEVTGRPTSGTFWILPPSSCPPKICTSSFQLDPSTPTSQSMWGGLERRKQNGLCSRQSWVHRAATAFKLCEGPQMSVPLRACVPVCEMERTWGFVRGFKWSLSCWARWFLASSLLGRGWWLNICGLSPNDTAVRVLSHTFSWSAGKGLWEFRILPDSIFGGRSYLVCQKQVAFYVCMVMTVALIEH